MLRKLRAFEVLSRDTLGCESETFEGRSVTTRGSTWNSILFLTRTLLSTCSGSHMTVERQVLIVMHMFPLSINHLLSGLAKEEARSLKP